MHAAAAVKGFGPLAAHVTDIIAPEIIGLDPTRQREIDQLMIELDGSENKSRLGANAILGVSMASREWQRRSTASRSIATLAARRRIDCRCR
jgi:enolase